MKKNKRTPLLVSAALPLAVIALLFIVIYQSIMIGHLSWSVELLSSRDVSKLVISGVENIGTNAPFDVATNSYYITEAKLRLPGRLKNDNGLRYANYSPAESFDEIDIAINRTVSRASASMLTYSTTVDDAFSKVPKLQACSHQFTISIDKTIKRENLGIPIEKRLADGRTVYIYTNEACGIETELSLNYLKNIESY